MYLESLKIHCPRIYNICFRERFCLVDLSFTPIICLIKSKVLSYTKLCSLHISIYSIGNVIYISCFLAVVHLYAEYCKVMISKKSWFSLMCIRPMYTKLRISYVHLRNTSDHSSTIFTMLYVFLIWPMLHVCMSAPASSRICWRGMR